MALAKSDRQGDSELYETFLSWSGQNKDRKIQKWHHYFDIYDRHLNPSQEAPR